MSTILKAISIIPAALLCVLAVPASGQLLNEDSKIIAADGEGYDRFGYAMDVWNGIIAVGAFGDDDNGTDSGSAYLFDAATGNLLFKLLPDDGAAGDYFGSSIAIKNGVVAVGAILDDDNGENSGSVYLFDVATGTQLNKIVPQDGQPGDAFGWYDSLAIGNGILAAGTPLDDVIGVDAGSVYIFDISTGNQITKIISDGGVQQLFGYTIAIGDGVLAVSEVQNDDKLYLYDMSTFQMIDQIIPDPPNAGFGDSLDIQDGILAVGSTFTVNENGQAEGSAFLYDLETGLLITELFASDGDGGHSFGSSVSIDSGVVAVGARNASNVNGVEAGAAYLFDIKTGDEIAKLESSDGAWRHYFGLQIELENGTAFVSAEQAVENGIDTGAVYTFSVPREACPADLTGEGDLDFFDVSAFLTAFSNMDTSADFTGDGNYDFFDVSAFLNAFATGCP